MCKWYERDPDEPGIGQYERRRRRYFKQLHLAIPPWANGKAINAYYKLAKKLGKEVYHIVPVCSRYVCGLHCEANLQLMDPGPNNYKSNHDWPDSPYERHRLFDDPNEPEQYELPI